MRKIMKKGISLVLIAGLAITCIANPLLATIDSEKKNLTDLQNEKGNAQKILDQLEADKNDMAQYVAKLDGELSTISAALYKTQQELGRVEVKIEKTEKKLKEAEESIKEQYSSMKLRIQFMYENGNQEMLTMILGSESISDFLNKAEYISELSNYDRKMLDKMRKTKQTIEDAKVALEENRAALVELKADQEQKQADVETLVAAKQRELAAYDTKIANSENMLDELDSKIENQKALVSEMESIEARRQEEARQRQQQQNNGGGNSNNNVNVTVDGYAWPIPGYTSISSGFGYRSNPFGGGGEYHSGIDMPAPSGTSITAAAAGEVAWANYSSTAGNWIGIDHGNGVYTIYMHMSALLVSAGQMVSQGQTIGLVGTTGSSTGNHLHFSVRKNGAYVNPLNYVKP